MSQIFPPVRRNRFWYGMAIAIAIVFGLASRRYPQLLPAILDKYPGDVLWTIVVFLLGGIVLPQASPLKIAGLALVISYLVEFGQLYQAPWIVAIRRTTIGHLCLGSQFAWEDLVAYTVGAAIAFLLELAWLRTVRSPGRRNK